MITENDVLKAIVECRRTDGRTYYEDIEKHLGLDRRFLKHHIISLKKQGYVDAFLEAMDITDYGLLAYDELKLIRRIRRFLPKFTKLSLKVFVNLIITIIAGLSVIYLAHHFGWQ